MNKQTEMCKNIDFADALDELSCIKDSLEVLSAAISPDNEVRIGYELACNQLITIHSVLDKTIKSLWLINKINRDKIND